MSKHFFFLLLGVSVSFQSWAKVDKDCAFAFELAKYEQFTRAQKKIDSKKCPLMAVYIKWRELRYKDNKASFKDHYDFLNTHSDWPFLHEIRKNMEKRKPSGVSEQALKKWFQKNPPSTVEGITLYSTLLKKLGSRSGADKVLRDFWRMTTDEKEASDKFLTQHKKVLREEDHWARVSHLLWEGKADLAHSFLKYLNKTHHLIAEARLALLRNDEKNLQKALKNVPFSHRQEEGLLFERLKWHRRFDEANAFDFYQDIRSKIQTHQENWIKEKLILVRDLMRYRRYKEAYTLAAHHSFKDGKFFAESEWLAGFIAYRFLKEYKTAVIHFDRLLKIVKKPTSLTQAAYWGALAQEKVGNEKQKIKWLKLGSHYTMSFYGQLCCEKLGLKGYLSLYSPKNIPQKVRQKTTSHKFAKVVQMVRELDSSLDVLPFLYIMLIRAQTKQERVAVVELADHYSPIDTVELSETLEDTDNFMYTIGYPLLKKVKWRENIDKALVHAIIRKESKFNPTVTSWMGAIGLMQIMPKTGEHIAKEMKLKKYSPQILYNRDKNLEFGQSYVEEIYNEYDKYLTLFLAAYNAGPGNVTRKWLPLIGDPRKGDIDELTWIEMVPFSQTRHYIMKVTSNYKIFKNLIAPK